MSRNVETIQRISKDTFKDHVITAYSKTVHVEYFKFQKPGTWMYGCVILATSASVTVFGDFGTLVIDRYGLDWLERTLLNREIDWRYLGSKAASDYPSKAFCIETAKQSLIEHFTDSESELTEHFTDSESELTEEIRCEIDDLETPDQVREFANNYDVFELEHQDYTSNFVWCAIGLKAFLEFRKSQRQVAA